MQTIDAFHRFVNTTPNWTCPDGFRAWAREALKLATLTVLVTIALW